jgi:hypothetical protein
LYCDREHRVASGFVDEMVSVSDINREIVEVDECECVFSLVLSIVDSVVRSVFSVVEVDEECDV